MADRLEIARPATTFKLQLSIIFKIQPPKLSIVCDNSLNKCYDQFRRLHNTLYQTKHQSERHSLLQWRVTRRDRPTWRRRWKW
jgi:hypothetical protein